MSELPLNTYMSKAKQIARLSDNENITTFITTFRDN